ncbi:cytochrome b [Caulobacter sp. RL271]|jgi:cytochrome b561|uniref:Cytochrome b/b6 domain-containing protein n=1 Tax=Caulobacter segnis TaxID=88688 RepID=A0ABY5A1C2_9CAUL|nr:cytochrome b/b6 domain-containing protein [Caulobacter segnis]USQ98560.1 cytochrome b/b6 domain-containing protein [Caulobacter segnis]
MTSPSEDATPRRYPSSMRALHWLRAILLLGLIALGWWMTSLPDAAPIKFALYPVHKQLGVTVFLIAIVALIVRGRSTFPGEPRGLSRWEAILSHITHRALLVLALVVPLMGYAMSSSYVDSDGVPFLFTRLPELLPKSDVGFAVFQWLHRILAYALLGFALLHVVGALKHRLTDRGGETDVLGRMT